MVDDVLHDLTGYWAREYQLRNGKIVLSLPVQQLHRDIWQEYGWRDWPYLGQFEEALVRAGFKIAQGVRADRRKVEVERIVVI